MPADLSELVSVYLARPMGVMNSVFQFTNILRRTTPIGHAHQVRAGMSSSFICFPNYNLLMGKNRHVTSFQSGDFQVLCQQPDHCTYLTISTFFLVLYFLASIFCIIFFNYLVFVTQAKLALLHLYNIICMTIRKVTYSSIYLSIHLYPICEIKIYRTQHADNIIWPK